MPIYDYKCEKCEKVQEHLVKNSEVTPPCKHCGAINQLTRQVSTGTNFKLVGGGWTHNS